MNSPIRIVGADFPKCAHPGCRSLALDGFCIAGCCADKINNAYCSEHSHRPRAVLEILGYSPTQETFTAAEVDHILKAMWTGAGLVFESMGHFAMLKQVRAKRELEGVPVGDIADKLRPR